jgi:hypothetical protein
MQTKSIGAGWMGAYAYPLYWEGNERTVDGEARSDRGRLYIEQWQWCSMMKRRLLPIIWSHTDRRLALFQADPKFPQGHVAYQKVLKSKVSKVGKGRSLLRLRLSLELPKVEFDQTHVRIVKVPFNFFRINTVSVRASGHKFLRYPHLPQLELPLHSHHP